MFLKPEDLKKTSEYWLEVIQNDLYREVHAYMKREKLNQTKLAAKLGVSKGYISQVLKGQFNHTLKKLIELSLAIGKYPNVQFDSFDQLPRVNVVKIKQEKVYIRGSSVTIKGTQMQHYVPFIFVKYVHSQIHSLKGNSHEKTSKTKIFHEVDCTESNTFSQN